MTIATGHGKRNRRARRRTPAGWPGLAASPVFAAMAVHSAFADAADPICAAVKGPLPLNGMTVMYLLMCLFHLPPWMKLERAPHPLSPQSLSKETDQ